jgi:hypothetical protein
MRSFDWASNEGRNLAKMADVTTQGIAGLCGVVEEVLARHPSREVQAGVDEFLSGTDYALGRFLEVHGHQYFPHLSKRMGSDTNHED